MKGRITAFRDRGVLKFRISQKIEEKEIVIGFLNLSGLVRWMEAQRRKPTVAPVSYLRK